MQVLKNTLSLVVTILFILIAFATSFAELPLSMEVKLNADSTAVVVKNLEEFNMNNASLELIPKGDSTLQFVDSLRFTLDSFALPANTVKTIPFSSFRNIRTRLPFTVLGVKPSRLLISSIVPKKKCGCSLLCSKMGSFVEEFD